MAIAQTDNDYLARPDNTDLDHIPGDYSLPYLGCMIPLVRDPARLTQSYYERFGPVCRVRTTGQKMVWALGPEFNKEIAVDAQKIYSAHMGYIGMLGDFFAGGLLMKDFGDHLFHRRIMQTAFKNESLRQQVSQINAALPQAVGAWGRQSNFLFYPAIKALLLDIGARVFVGPGIAGAEQQLNAAFLDMMAGVLSIIRRDWPGLLYRRGMNGRRALERFFLDLMPAKRVSDGQDMMSLFARERDDEGNLYSDETVRNHMIFLLLAAHDTTTSALTMAAYYLARHPEWQQRLREEAQSLDKAAPDYDDIKNRMPLAELSFQEILRLHPPVPQMMRRTIADTELGGYAIPRDTLVAVSPVFCHRMTEYWRDPHCFDPERFGPERAEHKAHPYLWTPFGGGAHKCIGMHFADVLYKCVLFDMLKRYRWQLPDNYPANPVIMHFPFAKLKDDLPLRFTALS